MRLFTVHAEPPPPPGPEGWPEPKARPPVLVRGRLLAGWPPSSASSGSPGTACGGRRWCLLVLTLGRRLLLPDRRYDAVVRAGAACLAGFEARDRLRRAGPPRPAAGRRGGGAGREIAWFRLMQQRPDLVRTRAPHEDRRRRSRLGQPRLRRSARWSACRGGTGLRCRDRRHHRGRGGARRRTASCCPARAPSPPAGAGWMRCPAWSRRWRTRCSRRGKPFLGICVGMQLMAERGLEHGVTPGLGWIAGEIAPMDPRGPDGRRCRCRRWAGTRWTSTRRRHPLLDGLGAGRARLFRAFLRAGRRRTGAGAGHAPITAGRWRPSSGATTWPARSSTWRKAAWWGCASWPISCGGDRERCRSPTPRARRADICGSSGSPN